MSYDEQRISDQIDGGLQTQKEQFSKPFIVANVRDIIDGWEHFDPEGYSFSKMVEILNEVADKHFGKNVTEPKEKPEDKKGFATYTPGDEKYYKQC